MNSLKVELTSETDLFFNYIVTIDEDTFIKMKDEQKLNGDYHNFLDLVVKMVDRCQNEPQNYFAVLFMERDGFAKMNFVENMEYKFLELLSLDF
mmetsp:Transcript_25693/g.22709  ORF Transcript_25693/g.22709 Transcript_25693/m.22709 type:complete len:94 (+) Transcript_25693:314-595(+)